MNAELVPMDCVCSWEHVSLLNQIFLVSSRTKGEGAKCEADDLKTALRRFLVNKRKMCLFLIPCICWHVAAGLDSQSNVHHVQIKSSLLNLSCPDFLSLTVLSQ